MQARARDFLCFSGQRSSYFSLKAVIVRGVVPDNSGSLCLSGYYSITLRRKQITLLKPCTFNEHRKWWTLQRKIYLSL
jgi:hypothetical protein